MITTHRLLNQSIIIGFNCGHNRTSAASNLEIGIVWLYSIDQDGKERLLLQIPLLWRNFHEFSCLRNLVLYKVIPNAWGTPFIHKRVYALSISHTLSCMPKKSISTMKKIFQVLDPYDTWFTCRNELLAKIHTRKNIDQQSIGIIIKSPSFLCQKSWGKKKKNKPLKSRSLHIKLGRKSVYMVYIGID